MKSKTNQMKLSVSLSTTLLCLISVFFSTSTMANDSDCEVLAKFYEQAVAATETKFDKSAFAKEVKGIFEQSEQCAETLYDFKVDGFFISNKAYPIEFTFLKEALVPEARFKLAIQTHKGKPMGIEFDIESVGALRKRPTR